jgi:hypothetical protein
VAGEAEVGGDDFTMATGNALLCWAFGRLVY